MKRIACQRPEVLIEEWAGHRQLVVDAARLLSQALDHIPQDDPKFDPFLDSVQLWLYRWGKVIGDIPKEAS